VVPFSGAEAADVVIEDDGVTVTGTTVTDVPRIGATTTELELDTYGGGAP